MHLIFWPTGTLAFSALLVTNELASPIIGWGGIAAALLSILVGGMKLAKRDYRFLFAVSGLLGILFEIAIGGWLLFSSHIIP